MVTGWRYRAAALAGVLVLTPVAIVVGNSPGVQEFLQQLPVYDRFWTRTLGGAAFWRGAALVVVVVALAMLPLYKPRPRRILDVVGRTQRRLLLAAVVLAAVGYFDWTYRLPRPMLVVTTAVLLLALPVWFLLIRQRVREEDHRALVVGDDRAAIDAVLEALDRPVIGYVAPTSRYLLEAEPTTGPRQYADGGTVLARAPLHERLPCLGGLSKLEDILMNHDVDTVALAFEETDRHVFFGVLELCHRHGVTAKTHHEVADGLLTQDSIGPLADLDLAPWDWQDRLFKRAFDVAFAATFLVVLAPVVLAVALAVKLEGRGPVFYAQERTATFGETFTIYKFRTMEPAEDDPRPIADEENDRISPVGRFLRRTHLDEIPQLWTVLAGTMSVVGPRAAWTDEETLLETRTGEWRKRWFVKPGLTGLAQINDVESTEPERKLQYDVEYISRQSFWFDVQIVTRQLWLVFDDVVNVVGRSRTS